MSTVSEPLADAGNRQHARNLTSLLGQIAAQVHVDPELARRLDAVRDYIVEPRDADRPFLTVLLRTQGQRIEALKDALLCLQGQSSGFRDRRARSQRGTRAGGVCP